MATDINQPITWDAIIRQGDTFAPVITYTDSSGNPINVTGYKARLQCRSALDDDATVFSLTETAGITVGTTDGTFKPILSAATTAALPVGPLGRWQMVIESGARVVTTLFVGSPVVEGAIVR